MERVRIDSTISYITTDQNPFSEKDRSNELVVMTTIS